MTRTLPTLVLGFLIGCGGSAADPGATPSDAAALASDADSPAPACPQVETVLTATLTAGDDGLTEWLDIPVPSGALAFEIRFQGRAEVAYVADALRSPDGAYAVPEGWWRTATVPVCLKCLNRVLPARGEGAILVPIQPGIAATPGLWRLRLLSFGGAFPPAGVASQVTVTVTVKRGAEVPDQGRLTLAVHLTGAGGFTADAPPIDAIAHAAALLAPAGIDLEVAGYHDVDPGLLALDADGLEPLYATSRAPAGTVAVYVVRTLTGAGVELAGFTNIPGGAGVVLATEGAADLGLGETLAHELGHSLGLFHTAEADGRVLDPIPDTPAASADNLMTYNLKGGALTPQQGEIMRAHPVVQHDCAPGRASSDR